MKEAYVKPAFYIERFSLTQNIANNCGVPTGGSSLGNPGNMIDKSCGWDIGTGILFISGVENCNIPVDPDAEVSGVCYMAPNSSNAIFATN